MHVNKSIKKTLPRLAILMILLFLTIIIPLNISLQIYLQHHNQQDNSIELFSQLEQIINNNNLTIEETKKEFKDRCIRSADVVAFTVSKDRSLLFKLEELQEFAHKLEIDEIHYFNDDGEIVSGTHPEYYGLNFNSGEQMNFFKPMLSIKNLKLCQDIVLNTAEKKNMQYAAVWLEDKSGIIQIGMEPIRLEEYIQERSLENIISHLPADLNGYLHIVDNKSNKIIASSKEDLIGYDVSGIVSNEKNNDNEIKMFHQEFNNTKFCVYTKSFDDYTFVRSYTSSHVVADTLRSSFLIMIYIIAGTIGIILAIRWYIQNKVINNLDEINNELHKIEEGNIEQIDLHTGIIELEDLVFYINKMLNSIKLNWNKLTYIMDKTGIPIGIAEKNIFYKNLMVNNRLLNILEIDNSEHIYNDNELTIKVEQTLDEIKKNNVDESEYVYKYENNGNIKYLRIETMKDEQSVVDYVSDISLWWNELRNAKIQSEIDILTGLFNRRGFYRSLDITFANENILKKSAMLMIDADNLKYINDSFGHYIGDDYLISLAKELEIVAGVNAICSRLGGDEFAILLYGCDDIDSLNKRIDKIKDIRNKEYDLKESNKMLYLQFSIGIAYHNIDGSDYHALLRKADENMYIEKNINKRNKNV